MSNCAYCGKPFIAKHQSQRFCSKRKTGRKLCKDRFHNRRRERETQAESAGDGPWDDFSFVPFPAQRGSQ